MRLDLFALWWSFSARASCIGIHTCRCHARWRRSLRRSAAQLPRSPFMATAESRLHWSTGGAQSTLSKNRRLVVVVTGGQREGEREGKRVWGEEEGNRFLDLFRNLGHRKNRCQRPPPQLPSKSTSHQHYTPGMYLPQKKNNPRQIH